MRSVQVRRVTQVDTQGDAHGDAQDDTQDAGWCAGDAQEMCYHDEKQRCYVNVLGAWIRSDNEEEERTIR